MEPTSLHPPLSLSDRTLLTSYLAHDQNLPALAAHLASNPPPADQAPDQGPAGPSPMPCALSLVPSPDYFSLLTWLTQPHIRAFLDAHDHAAARADQATARSDRLLAATALRRAIEDADSTLELRRAATSLARASLARASLARASHVPGLGSRLREQSSPQTATGSPSNSSHTLASAIRTLTRPNPPSPRLDGGRWSEAVRGPEGGMPVSVDAPIYTNERSEFAHSHSNGHMPAHDTQASRAPALSRRATQARTPEARSPETKPAPPPAHTFSEPLLTPFPRLPPTSPAALLRAKAGAAPPHPPDPHAIPWLTNSS